jgi:hypothetical protein
MGSFKLKLPANDTHLYSIVSLRQCFGGKRGGHYVPYIDSPTRPYITYDSLRPTYISIVHHTHQPHGVTHNALSIMDNNSNSIIYHDVFRFSMTGNNKNS